MKRLRHPIRAVREPFGTAGLIVACVALIAALAGGAYAASGALTFKQKKEVTKIAQTEAKKFATAGPTGSAGKDGSNGTNGKDGSSGTSVTTATIPISSATCNHLGGVEVKSASSPTQVVCNGEQGATGPTGTVLPPGETLTGYWSFGGEGTEIGGVPGLLLTISYPLRVEPLPAEFEPSTNYRAVGEGPNENCPGTVNEPKAAPGQTCIYAKEVAHAGSFARKEPSRTGALEMDRSSGWSGFFEIEEEQTGGYGYGTWAVRAACPPEEPEC